MLISTRSGRRRRTRRRRRRKRKKEGGSVPPMENLLSGRGDLHCRWLRMANTTQAGNVATAIAASKFSGLIRYRSTNYPSLPRKLWGNPKLMHSARFQPRTRTPGSMNAGRPALLRGKGVKLIHLQGREGCFGPFPTNRPRHAMGHGVSRRNLSDVGI